jgi:hypothetical protein
MHVTRLKFMNGYEVRLHGAILQAEFSAQSIAHFIQPESDIVWIVLRTSGAKLSPVGHGCLPLDVAVWDPEVTSWIRLEEEGRGRRQTV